MRAMVPVDLRPRERALELGNDFGLVILDLPVSVADVLQRLRVTKENMDALKRSPEAFAVKTLFNIFGRVPKRLEDVAVDLFTSKTSVVMTNVAGPWQTLYLAGVLITRMMFWVPHPGRQMGVGISILSYNNSVTLAVVSDAHLMPDPEIITEQFGREFDRMLELGRQAQAACTGRPRQRKRRPPRRTVRPPPNRDSRARTGRWLARSTVARTSQEHSDGERRDEPADCQYRADFRRDLTQGRPT